VGLLLGPAFNLVLAQLELTTPLGRLTKLNSPGLLLCLAWAVFSGLVAGLYTDLAPLAGEQRLQAELSRAYLRLDSLPESEDSSPRHPGSASEAEVSEEEEEDRDTEDRETEEEEDMDTENRETGLLFTEAETTYPMLVGPPPDTALTAGRLALDPLEPHGPLALAAVRAVGEAVGPGEGVGPGPGSRYGAVAPWPGYHRRARHGSGVSRKSDLFMAEAERLMAPGGRAASRERGGELQGEREALLGAGAEARAGPRPQSPNRWREVADCLIRPELVALVVLRFVALFCQTSLESIVPPVMQVGLDHHHHL
jgi:hypothetical protein